MPDLSSIVELWTGGPGPSIDGFRQIAARSILAAKVAMRENFPAGLVHDPVGEIMMSVFIAGATRGAMPFNDVCASAGVGVPTATRWISALEQEELVEITTGANGKWVALTAEGLAVATRAIDAVLALHVQILG